MHILTNLYQPNFKEAFLDSRPGRLLRLKKEDIQKAMDWFDSKGNYTVFFCRFIPIVRSLISIPAGTARMDLKRFFLMTALGSFLWNVMLVCLGAAAGSSWQKAAAYFENYTQAAKIVMGVFLIIGLLLFFGRRSRIHKKNSQ